MAMEMLSYVGETDAAMEFVTELIRKRGQLRDGSGLTHSKDGLVAYEKTQELPMRVQNDAKVAESRAAKQKHKEQQQKLKQAEVAKKDAMAAAREECYCMGTSHAVLGNCLSCGKIICKAEGRDMPCLFCGELFTGNLQSLSSSAQFAAAVSRKNALLEYEEKSVARSLIYDDQADYFNSEDTQWTSKEERAVLREKEKQMREKKQQQKRAVRISLDIFGRRMVMEEDPDANQSIYQPFNLDDLIVKKPIVASMEEAEDNRKLHEAAAEVTQAKPTYSGIGAKAKAKAKTTTETTKAIGSKGGSNSNHRIQHEYFEIEEGQEPDDTNSKPAVASSAEGYAITGVVYENGFSSKFSRNGSETNVMSLADFESAGRPKRAVVSFKFPLASMEPLSELARADSAPWGVCLDFSNFDGEAKVKQSLAKQHGDIVNTISALSKSVIIWVRPRHHLLQYESNYDPAVCSYWTNLNKVLSKDVAMVLSVSDSANPVISVNHIEIVRGHIGSQRPLILWDHIAFETMQPSRGRQRKLDIEGVLVIVKDSSMLRTAAIGVLSSLECFGSPVTYDPMSSAKRIITAALGGPCKEVQYLLDVLRYSPSILRSKIEGEAFVKQLSSKRHMEELAESVEGLRDQKIRDWLGSEMVHLEHVLASVEELVQRARVSQVMSDPSLTNKERKEKVKTIRAKAKLYATK